MINNDDGKWFICDNETEVMYAVYQVPFAVSTSSSSATEKRKQKNQVNRFTPEFLK